MRAFLGLFQITEQSMLSHSNARRLALSRQGYHTDIILPAQEAKLWGSEHPRNPESSLGTGALPLATRWQQMRIVQTTT